VSDLELAFPAGVNPKLGDVPKEFFDRNPWHDLVNHLFYRGGEGLRMLPHADRSAEDQEKAFRWLRACLGSYDLKHEHKMAVCAWILASTWWCWWFGDDKPKWLELEGGEE
jgi:hypothetical protein